MKKGIRCFDNTTVTEKNETLLKYKFVCGDEEIASSCRVSLGDVDPATGEKIVDREIFREIRYIQYDQAYHNRYENCVPWSKWEKEARNETRSQLAEEFIRDYGYAPDEDSLDWMLKEKWPNKYRVSIDAIPNSKSDEQFQDCLLLFEDTAASDAIQLVECSLDEFEKTLNDRERELFHLLQLKSEGFSIHGAVNDLADKWGVEQYKVSRMKKQIGLKLVKWLQDED